MGRSCEVKKVDVLLLLAILAFEQLLLRYGDISLTRDRLGETSNAGQISGGPWHWRTRLARCRSGDDSEPLSVAFFDLTSAALHPLCLPLGLLDSIAPYQNDRQRQRLPCET